MGKQERIRELTWKYFLEQKTQEIVRIYLITVICFLLPLTTGFLFFGLVSEVILGSTLFVLFITWFAGLLISLFLLLIGGVIYEWVIKGIIDWIKSNWQKAERRAQKEVKGGIK